MRIITGDFRGTKLEVPSNYDVRPTTDKVKEALFNIICRYLEDAIVVDLFAGTGNLGLEALSIGACKCHFCDNSITSVKLIKKNIEHCKAEEHSVIHFCDFTNCLNQINEKINVFFLDPPYKKNFYEKCFVKIKELDLMADEGIIIAEHSKDEEFPDYFCGFNKLKEKRYGTIIISIYG